MKLRGWSERYYWLIIAFDFVAAGALALLFAPSPATPIIGATTALLIAFVAYPWQKQQDNNIRVLEEKRKAYQAFMISVDKLERSFHLPKPDLLILDQVSSAYNVLALYADKVVLDAAWSWVGAIWVRHKFGDDPPSANVNLWNRPVKPIPPNFDSSGGILILIERLVYVETMS